MKDLYNSIRNEPELVIASVALIISFISITFGVIGLYIQRNHNKKSVLPIGTINFADYEDVIKIRISNNGIGPMIIKSCNTKGKNKTKPYPIDWMPKGIIWDTFRKELEGHSIISGEYLTLLQLTINTKKKNEIRRGDAIRSILKDLEIIIEYKDIYGRTFTASRKLDWFGRTLKEKH